MPSRVVRVSSKDFCFIGSKNASLSLPFSSPRVRGTTALSSKALRVVVDFLDLFLSTFDGIIHKFELDFLREFDVILG